MVAEAVGVRQIMTTAELRDLIAPLKFFWLDVFAGDEAVQKEVLTELGLDAAEVLWALRFGQVPRMAIGQHGVRVVTWLAESAGTYKGRTIWIADAHRSDGKRFVVRPDREIKSSQDELTKRSHQILIALLELELAICA